MILPHRVFYYQLIFSVPLLGPFGPTLSLIKTPGVLGSCPQPSPPSSLDSPSCLSHQFASNSPQFVNLHLQYHCQEKLFFFWCVDREGVAGKCVSSYLRIKLYEFIFL